MFAAKSLVREKPVALLQLTRGMARRGGSNIKPYDIPTFKPDPPLVEDRCSLRNPDAPCRKRTDIKGPRCETTLDYEPCIPVPVYYTIWDHGCCEHPCPNMLPRFDQIYYKRTDKRCRHYHQTWVECKGPVKQERIRCCYDENELPPIERRERGDRPLTACNMQTMKQDECSLTKNAKCTRVALPGCRSRRNTFHCLVENNPSAGCPNRECAPYPSFSECWRSKLQPPPNAECGCVYHPMQCELNRDYERWLHRHVRQSPKP